MLPVLPPSMLQVAVAPVSMSLELSVPVALTVLSSVTAPAALPVAKAMTGWSLVPVIVTVTLRAIELPLPSMTSKEKVSTLV